MARHPGNATIRRLLTLAILVAAAIAVYAGWRYLRPGQLPDGIAAGNGRGSGVAGCAPEADLIFVEASSSRLPWNGPQAVGVSFGDSVQLLEAVAYIFERAGDRPCVVNLSLGSPRRSLAVEQKIEELALRGIACVVAAGNTGGASASEAPDGASKMIERAARS